MNNPDGALVISRLKSPTFLAWIAFVLVFAWPDFYVKAAMMVVGADPVRDWFVPAAPRTSLESSHHWATTEFCIMAAHVVVSAFSRFSRASAMGLAVGQHHRVKN